MSLPRTLAIYLLTPLLLNGLIFSLHWDSAGPTSPMLPPGWVVGLIWMALFALMGLARYTIDSSESRTSSRQPLWIDLLALLCLAYPLYTAGLSSVTRGFAGILVTLAFTLAAANSLRSTIPRAAALLLPLIAWLSYAGIAVALLLHSHA